MALFFPTKTIQSRWKLWKTSKIKKKNSIQEEKFIIYLADYLKQYAYTHKGYLPQFEILILPHQLR